MSLLYEISISTIVTDDEITAQLMLSIERAKTMLTSDLLTWERKPDDASEARPEFQWRYFRMIMYVIRGWHKNAEWKMRLNDASEAY